MSGWALFALQCARPGAAWALLLPVAFLLALRILARPPEVVVGTLELWQARSSLSPLGRARMRVPPWAVFVVLALFLGALAWLGPRGARAEGVRTWTCVVDRSPSMGLADGADATRLATALASALGWLARECGPGDRVRWLAPGRAPLELACDGRPEPAWLEPERGPGGEPEWALHDHPGALWITDREPPVARTQAGLFASGGAAVPGPVAADGRTTWTWDGQTLSAKPSPRPLAVQVREPAGRALPAVLERVLGAWCEARGLELARGTEHETLLQVELAAGNEGDDEDDEEVVLERDGWRASGRGTLPELDQGARAGTAGDIWLAARTPAGATLPVVRASPGRIELGLRALGEPAGDPALFAISWAQLFDRAALRPAGVVPLDERRAAGAPAHVPGVPATRDEGAGTDPGPVIDALLALGAFLAALLAGSVRGRALVGEHAVRGQARVAAASHQ